MDTDDEGNRLVWGVVIAFGVILFFAGFVWLWWHWIPVLYEGYNGITQAERLTAVTNTRVGLLAGLVGLGALGTFWLNSRVYRVTAQTFRVTERGHLTDRYAKAIEQLGSGKLDLRLGGIYALEQLAADSEVARDQATIVEVLSAFVRVHSQPRYQYAQQESYSANPRQEELDEFKDGLRRPPDDVQAAVTVLARLPDRPELQRADFNGAFLRRAIMAKGEMAFSEIHEGQVLTWQSSTPNDDATGNLARAAFVNADLTGAFFTFANLNEAHFINTNLTRAQMTNANLTGSVFIRVDVTNANLTGANLTKADLGGAILENAQLHGANLLLAKNLTQERLDSALGDSTTKLPPYLRRPELWTQVNDG